MGDEAQFLLFPNSGSTSEQGRRRGPKARRAHVTFFVRRSAASLQQFLQQLAAEGRGGTMPSAILGRLLTSSRALWRLLLEAAESVPELGPPVRGLLTRVLTEGAARMRDTARHLPKDLLQMPYFSHSGPLAMDIQTLVKER